MTKSHIKAKKAALKIHKLTCELNKQFIYVEDPETIEVRMRNNRTYKFNFDDLVPVSCRAFRRKLASQLPVYDAPYLNDFINELTINLLNLPSKAYANEH